MNALTIRGETAADQAAIRQVTVLAFSNEEHGGQLEAGIIDQLRADEQLGVSLVATSGPQVIGHIAASAVTIGDGRPEWFGIGPVSVHPAHQRQGVGKALLQELLALLRGRDAGGVVVLGDPAYYTRFGLSTVPGLRFSPAPAEYFMALRLGDHDYPQGEVTYHPAFGS